MRCKDELSVNDRVLLRGSRVIVPPKARYTVKNRVLGHTFSGAHIKASK